MNRILLLLIISLSCFISCSSPEEKVIDMATSQLKATLEDQTHFKVLNISKVDTAYGVTFTEQEMRYLFTISNKVTKKIMVATNNLRDIANADVGMLALIDRQMRSSLELRDLLLKGSRKSIPTGYKLKIAYQSVDSKGIPYKAERWFFINEDGSQIIKTFELPLP